MKKIKFLVICLTITLADTVVGQSIQQIGPNYFAAGVPSHEMQFFASSQRSQNWCWAACVQTVLNYHGLYVTQEQVVHKIYGSLIDRPADERQIRAALSGWAPNIQGGISQIYCQSGMTSINDITNNLAYKWPLIVGLRNYQGGTGHAYVLTAIYYSTDIYNNVVPYMVVLRDPWPESPSRQEMSWSEFSNRVTMIFKVWVTR
jgi:hypothetical protein